MPQSDAIGYQQGRGWGHCRNQTRCVCFVLAMKIKPLPPCAGGFALIGIDGDN